MRNIKSKLLIIALLISISVNVFTILSFKVNSDRQNTLNEHAMYYIFKSSLEEFYASIYDIDKDLIEIKNNNKNNQHIIKNIDKAILRLKDSESFMLKAWSLNESFDFNISSFYLYLKKLSFYGHQNLEIPDEDIEILREIVNTAKELVPDKYIVEMDIKEVYYNSLIAKDSIFSDDGKQTNQLYPSKLLKDTFDEIAKISSQAVKDLPKRIKYHF